MFEHSHEYHGEGGYTPPSKEEILAAITEGVRQAFGGEVWAAGLDNYEILQAIRYGVKDAFRERS